MTSNLLHRLLVVATLWASSSLVVTANAGPEHAGLPKSSHIPATGNAVEPKGHSLLCHREPSLCENGSRTPAVRDSHELWDKLDAVNRYVNQAITPEPEKPGGQDFWKVGGAAGDCEDYALWKRELLAKAGVPRQDLLIATAYLPNRDYHAVLIAHMTDGDYVLDNLSREILPWSDTPLDFVSIQSPNNPRIWRSVEENTSGANSVTAGAASR